MQMNLFVLIVMLLRVTVGSLVLKGCHNGVANSIESVSLPKTTGPRAMAEENHRLKERHVPSGMPESMDAPDWAYILT